MSKKSKFNKQNNNLHVLVHIFAVTARSPREIALCDVLWRTLTQDLEFFFSFLNLSAVQKNSTWEKFDYIRHFKRDKVWKKKRREFILKVTFALRCRRPGC